MEIATKLKAGAAALQFRIDVFPQLDYQPLPWLGLHRARRGQGTVARWQVIEALLDKHTITSGMDIGCQVGYFPIALARKGISMVGIDVDARALRIARYASKKLEIRNVGWWSMMLTPETIGLLPQVDLTLLLSIWHHWVRDYGVGEADEMLATVWSRCKKALAFETGESEMPTSWGLPAMEPSPQEWLENHLNTICIGGQAQHLGKFKAFAPSGDEEQHVVYRNLFWVSRLP